MLQTHEKRRAAEEAHRAMRDFRESRASLRPPTAANINIGRRTDYLAGLTQATEFHAQEVSEIHIQEAFQDPVGAFMCLPLESRESPSFVVAIDKWGMHIVSDKGGTPSVLDTGIEGVTEFGIIVPTDDDGGVVREPFRREEQAQGPPTNFGFTLSGAPVRHSRSPSIETGVGVDPAAHSFSKPVFISHIWADQLEPVVRLPGQARENDETANLLEYWSSIVRTGVADPMWECTLTVGTAPGKPDPVEVFSHIPPQLETLFREIAELPEDWNSYGAARISPWSITEARRVTNEGIGLGLPAPAISPASGASVGIEWQTDNADLVIDVDPQQGITYLIVDRASGEEIEGALNAGNRAEVLRKVMEI